MAANRLRILILDGDTNAARAALQSLGRAGHACWVAVPHARGSALLSRHAEARLVSPDPLQDRSEFVEWVAEKQRAHAIDFVLPVTELSLVPLHEERDALPPGVAILPPGPALETVLDKEALNRVAASLGIPTPASRLVPAGISVADAATFEEDVQAQEIARWPVVVKPVRSKRWIDKRGTSLHVRLAHDPEELVRRLRYLLPLCPVQIQDWVPGTGFGVEALARHGEIVLEFAHERLHEYPPSGGASTYRRSWRPPSHIRDAAARLLTALGWHGVAMVEFRIDSDTGRYWLMEVNGRLWGSLPLAIFAGVDFPTALIDMWQDLPLRTQRRRSGTVYARHVAGEIQWWKAVLRARGDRKMHPMRLPRAALEWMRVLGGREIWDGASLGDPLPLAHELITSLADEARGALRKLKRLLRDVRVRRTVRSQLAVADRARRVLVLCHGNICRSPYAAASLAERLRGSAIQVRSAGTGMRAGRTPPAIFQLLAAARGIDLSAHMSKSLDREILDWASLVVVMDEANRRDLAQVDPGAARRAVSLGALDPQGGAQIPDPYWLSAEEVALVLEKIDRAIDRLAEILNAHGVAGPVDSRPAERGTS